MKKTNVCKGHVTRVQYVTWPYQLEGMTISTRRSFLIHNHHQRQTCDHNGQQCSLLRHQKSSSWSSQSSSSSSPSSSSCSSSSAIDSETRLCLAIWPTERAMRKKINWEHGIFLHFQHHASFNYVVVGWSASYMTMMAWGSQFLPDSWATLDLEPVDAPLSDGP